ncbi:MAG: DUF1343 domain-containing protein [Bacteroidales bacterium]|nr:DUF1343 domain-containing protein [Bacteroidales bacterium]
MQMFTKIFFLLLICTFFFSCSCASKQRKINNYQIADNISQKDAKKIENLNDEVERKSILLGADKIETIKTIAATRNVALIINQTSMLSDNKTHLLDTLINAGVKVIKIFAPEHGFRGDADAGESVKNGVDVKSGLPIISLYGKNKKPSPEHLKDIDLVVFDIQDVGARFYTYISTMLYAIESCGENNVEMLILDRPNPNDTIDGPVLDINKKSFVGSMPTPVVHGMTVGEIASMIVGEGWAGEKKCKLNVVNVDNWSHGDPFHVAVKPSPNLPNDLSIRLYPSLCLFEATNVSVGRGTYEPFQIIGFPDKKYGDYTFTPKALPGFDKNPLQKDKLCYGYDLKDDVSTKGFSLKYFLDFYNKSDDKKSFISRPDFFDLLSGNSLLRQQILSGMTEQEIRESWQKDLEDFRALRSKYLLYKDY